MIGQSREKPGTVREEKVSPSEDRGSRRHSGQHSMLMSERLGLKFNLCHLLPLFNLSVHQAFTSASGNMILHHFMMVTLDNSKIANIIVIISKHYLSAL